MSLAIACSDDGDDSGNGGDATATEGMDETPPGTMSHDDSPGANEVHISETEYAIENLDGGELSSPAAGAVTFEVHNNGELVHELVIIKTGLDEAALPVVGDLVDEEGAGIEVIDEVPEFDPGGAEILTVDLEAGSYVLICNVEEHYGEGMHATLTVQ